MINCTLVWNNNYSSLAAGIVDGDADLNECDWEHTPRASGNSVTYPLRADRWWSTPGVLDEDDGRCLGIHCNIWARARRRRDITHNLRGGGQGGGNSCGTGRI